MRTLAGGPFRLGRNLRSFAALIQDGHPCRMANYVVRNENLAGNRRSSVGFQLSQGAREANLPSEPPQAGISPRSRNELQTGTNGLGDADTASSLRLLKKLLWYFHGDLTRCLHNGLLYHIRYQH